MKLADDPQKLGRLEAVLKRVNQGEAPSPEDEALLAEFHFRYSQGELTFLDAQGQETDLKLKAGSAELGALSGQVATMSNASPQLRGHLNRTARLLKKSEEVQVLARTVEQRSQTIDGLRTERARIADRQTQLTLMAAQVGLALFDPTALQRIDPSLMAREFNLRISSEGGRTRYFIGEREVSGDEVMSHLMLQLASKQLELAAQAEGNLRETERAYADLESSNEDLNSETQTLNQMRQDYDSSAETERDTVPENEREDYDRASELGHSQSEEAAAAAETAQVLATAQLANKDADLAELEKLQDQGQDFASQLQALKAEKKVETSASTTDRPAPAGSAAKPELAPLPSQKAPEASPVTAPSALSARDKTARRNEAIYLEQTFARSRDAQAKEQAYRQALDGARAKENARAESQRADVDQTRPKP
ncbi:MAG: hypothetical protein ACAI44_22235 [Candidatus Sericytochromatia bacterium]